MERDLDRPAVEIAVEVEEMRLEQLLRRIEHRADAEVGDARNARCRRRAARARRRCRSAGADSRRAAGWRSDSRARGRACRRAGPRPRSRTARVSRCVAVAGIAGLERVADAARGDALAVEQHRRDRLGGDAVRARRASRSTSALPPRPLPKVKSSPVTTPAAPMLLAEQLGDEILGAGRGERRRRTRTPASRRRRRGRTAPRAGRGVVRRNGGDVGLEVAHRVRVEGGDDRRPPLVGPRCDRAADHRLVAEVEAVEIAERDDRARVGRRGCRRSRVSRCIASALSGALALGNLRGSPLQLRMPDFATNALRDADGSRRSYGPPCDASVLTRLRTLLIG